MDRVVLLMEERGRFDGQNGGGIDVMVSVWDEHSVAQMRSMSRRLREDGWKADVYPEPSDGLGVQLSYADDRDADRLDRTNEFENEVHEAMDTLGMDDYPEPDWFLMPLRM